jgi:hypothetical protein
MPSMKEKSAPRFTTASFTVGSLARRRDISTSPPLYKFRKASYAWPTLIYAAIVRLMGKGTFHCAVGAVAFAARD